MKKTEW